MNCPKRFSASVGVVNLDDPLCTLNRLFSPLSAPSGYGDVVVSSCPLGKVAISAAYASDATPEQVPEGNGFRFFGAQPAADGPGYTFI